MSSKSSKTMIQCAGCDKCFNVDFPANLIDENNDRKKETDNDNDEYLCMSCTNLIMLPRALCGNLCEICGKIFSWNDSSVEGIVSDLTEHISSHGQDTLYRCVYCGRVFLRSVYLQVHQRIHTGEKPHVCHLCSERFITVYLLYKHRQEKHATEYNMMSHVAEISKEEDEGKKEEEESLSAIMIPEMKMEVISDEEVDMGDDVKVISDEEVDMGNHIKIRDVDIEMGKYNRIKVEFGEHNHTELDVDKGDHGGQQKSCNNDSTAINLLSAIQGHHNFSSSSGAIPSIMFINAPEHFLAPHNASESVTDQNLPLDLAMQRLPTESETSSNISWRNTSLPSVSQGNSLMSSNNQGNVLLPSISSSNHYLLQPFSSEKNQAHSSSLANPSILPLSKSYMSPETLGKALSKAKLDKQKLYIEQIESLEEIDFLDLRPEDVTIGLIFVIHEKKRANKLELTWEGVAEYFRNIFQMSNLNGRQLSRSFIGVAKRYELKKSQNSLEDYATCRYFPPGYHDSNIIYARKLSQFRIDLCNIPTMMLTNEYILKIFNFLVSGNCKNDLWNYIYECISKILDWKGPEQVIINGIMAVGNECIRLLTDNNHTLLVTYLNQLFATTILTHQNNGIPTTHNENLQNKDCTNLNFELNNNNQYFKFDDNYNLIDSKFDLEKESNIPPINPISKENLTANVTSSNNNLAEVKSYSTLSSPISVSSFRSYLSQEIEKQNNNNNNSIQQNNTEQSQLNPPKTIDDIIDKGIENESMESVVISGDEIENTNSFDSKSNIVTIEEYLKQNNDKDHNDDNDNNNNNNNSNDTCKQIKDMLFSSGEGLTKGQLVENISSNVKCTQIKDLIFSSDKSLNKEQMVKKKKCPESIAHIEQISKISKFDQISKITQTKEDDMRDLNSNIYTIKENLFSNDRNDACKRKNISDETQIKESIAKKHKVINSQQEKQFSSQKHPLRVNKTLTPLDALSKVRVPNLTKKNFTNFVACKMYENMSSNECIKDIYLTKLTSNIENIFELPNLVQQDVFYSFQKVHEKSVKLRDDKRELKLFLNSPYKPPQIEMDTGQDQEILTNLNEFISYNIHCRYFLSSVKKDFKEIHKGIENSDNNNYDDNNLLDKPCSLLPILSNLTAKNLSNKIVFEIFKESTRLSYEMKIKFWSEMRENFAKIFQIKDINTFNVCMNYSRVYNKAQALQNEPIKLETYLSSPFRFSRDNYNNKIFKQKETNDDNNLLRFDHCMKSDILNNRQEAESLNTDAIPISNADPCMLRQNQIEVPGAEFVHSETSEDYSFPNMKFNDSNSNLKDEMYSPKIKDDSSIANKKGDSDSDLKDDCRANIKGIDSNFNKEKASNLNRKDDDYNNKNILLSALEDSESDTAKQDITQNSCPKEIQQQHQDILDKFGLEDLTEETFINGVAWKIFKEMKTGEEKLLPSWEEVAVFVRNIYQDRNITKESLKESFEEIFTHCQLLKAKKEVASLKNYFNALYTFPM